MVRNQTSIMGFRLAVRNVPAPLRQYRVGENIPETGQDRALGSRPPRRPVQSPVEPKPVGQLLDFEPSYGGARCCQTEAPLRESDCAWKNTERDRFYCRCS